MNSVRQKRKSPSAGQGAEGSGLNQKQVTEMNSLNTRAPAQALLASAAVNLQQAACRLQEVQAHLMLAAGALQTIAAQQATPPEAFEVSDLDYVRQIVREFGQPRRAPWVCAFAEEDGSAAIDVTTHLDDVPLALRSLPRLAPPGRPVRIGRRQVRDARFIWRCQRASYAIKDIAQLADVAAACKGLFGRVPVSAAGGRA